MRKMKQRILQVWTILTELWRQKEKKKTKHSFSHVLCNTVCSNTTHFLAVWTSGHYLWSKSTIRLAQTLPTLQSSNKLAHELIFIVCVWVFPFGSGLQSLHSAVISNKSMEDKTVEWALSEHCSALIDMSGHRMGHKWRCSDLWS